MFRRHNWHLLIVITCLALMMAGCGGRAIPPASTVIPADITIGEASWGGDISQIEDTVRSAAILTLSYVTSPTFDVDRGNQLNLECLFTLGDATACRIKVEFSTDKTNWVQETDVEYSNGVATHRPFYRRRTVTGNFDIAIPGPNYRHYRVSALAEDDAAGTSLAITGVKSRL